MSKTWWGIGIFCWIIGMIGLWGLLKAASEGDRQLDEIERAIIGEPYERATV